METPVFEYHEMFKKTWKIMFGCFWEVQISCSTVGEKKKTTSVDQIAKHTKTIQNQLSATLW